MPTLANDLSALASGWLFSEVNIAVANGALVQLCQADPLRWAIQIGWSVNAQGQANQLVFSTVGQADATHGFLINNVQPYLRLSYRQVGVYVQQPFWCFNNGAAPVNINLIQVRAQQ